MDSQYEVLSPWAEADPIPLKGIMPRVTDLTYKTIGLFSLDYKTVSRPTLATIEEKLKERFPTAKFSWFEFNFNLEVTETKERARFEEWVKGIDTAIVGVGD